MWPVFNPEVIVSEVDADDAHSFCPHVSGKCNSHVGGIPEVWYSIAHDFNAAASWLNLKWDDRDSNTYVFFRRVREEVLRLGVRDIGVTVAFVLGDVVDVEEVGWVKESADVIDANSEQMFAAMRCSKPICRFSESRHQDTTARMNVFKFFKVQIIFNALRMSV